MIEQLLLDLKPRRLEGFIPARANSRALEALISFDMAAIVGASLSGKTEIAKATARQNSGVYLEDAENISAYLEAGDAHLVCLDDVDQIQDDTLLFHLYNFQKSQNQKLFLFASREKSQWRFELPDLNSRLGTIQEVEIENPDDGLVTALIVKWLYERGLQPRPKMVAYVAKRIERDYARIFDFVQKVDEYVGKTGLKPTRKLAKEILSEDWSVEV